MNLKTSIECVLFDLDGTLIDTAPDFVFVVNQLLAECSKPAIKSSFIYQAVSDGARALIKLAFDIGEEHEDFSKLNSRLLELYAEKLETTESLLYPGIDLLLLELEKSGVSWGIVTNKPELYSKKLLSQMNLLARCSALVCPDHVENPKPHPDAILLACQILNCDIGKTIFIGDHIRDIQAAKNAEVIAVAAEYGYISPDTKTEDWYADFIVKESIKILPLLNTLKFT